MPCFKKVFYVGQRAMQHALSDVVADVTAPRLSSSEARMQWPAASCVVRTLLSALFACSRRRRRPIASYIYLPLIISRLAPAVNSDGQRCLAPGVWRTPITARNRRRTTRIADTTRPAEPLASGHPACRLISYPENHRLPLWKKR